MKSDSEARFFGDPGTRTPGCRYNGDRLSSGCSKIGVWVCGMKWENDCYEFQLNRGSRTVRFDRTADWILDRAEAQSDNLFYFFDRISFYVNSFLWWMTVARYFIRSLIVRFLFFFFFTDKIDHMPRY